MPRRPPSPHSHGRSEVKARPEVMRQVARAGERIGRRLRALRERAGLTQEEAAELAGLHVKHLQRLERGAANATLATLVACARVFAVPLPSILGDERPAEPFQRLEPRSERPFRNALPLYSLRAVAGQFGAFQEVQPESWVRPEGRTRPAKGLFVAQVVGESMNRRIPSGSFCIFRAPPLAPLQGKIVVAQHRAVHDPEHGGHYTVKQYEARRGEIRLKPSSSSRRYRPLVFRGSEAGELTIVAELVEVLTPRAPPQRRRIS
ncbi:MAG TPA: helix-turn-helix domain-containing protein [Myxococcales bacterium]